MLFDIEGPIPAANIFQLNHFFLCIEYRALIFYYTKGEQNGSTLDLNFGWLFYEWGNVWNVNVYGS